MDTERLHVDYPQLDNGTNKNSRSLLRIDDALQALTDSTLFSTLNLRSR